MNESSESRGPERTPERDEVLRRVGRNVVNFQMVEAMLKHLNANASVCGPASELVDRIEAQRAAVHRKTMGELVGRMMTHVLQQPPDFHEVKEDAEHWVGFYFGVESDVKFIDDYEVEMRALVDARNDLIHHFLPRWYSAVDGDTDSALAYLDTQRDQTFRMLDRLRGWVKAMDDDRKQMSAFLTSPEYERQVELAVLQGSRLVLMLGEVSVKASRPDGWTLLSTAGSLIKRHAPEELDDFRKRYGHQSLKGILLAAQYFDVEEEQLPSGGSRTIYRINERYKLQIGQEEVSNSVSPRASSNA